MGERLGEWVWEEMGRGVSCGRAWDSKRSMSNVVEQPSVEKAKHCAGGEG